MTLTIAVDVDDTVSCTVDEWVRLYNLYYEDNLRLEDIKTWDIAHYAKKCSKWDLFDILSHLNPALVEQVPQSLSVIRFLEKMGHKVIFVSAGFTWDKGNWLVDNGYIDDEEDLIIAHNKELIRADILIDDNPTNIKAFKMAGGIGILYSRPWNISEDIRNRTPSWEDAYQIISHFAFDGRL